MGLLGPMSITDHTGIEITVRAGRQRVLLAALAVRVNEIVSMDQLADLVWDGKPPAGANGTLRVYVTRLRAVLGAAGAAQLVTREPGYLWRSEPEDVDIRRFAALCRSARAAVRAQDWRGAADAAASALALWRGTPLMDIPSQRLRERETPWLVQLRTQALGDRIAADIQLGGHREVLAELRQLVDAEPLREEWSMLLMTALYRDGRQSEAFAVYRDVQRALADELGTGPGPALRRLYQQILTVDADDPTPEQPPPALAAAVSMRGDIPDFTGREHETATLLAAVRTRSMRAVAAYAVDGMAGVGKTAFCIHLAHQLAGDFPDGGLFLELHGHTPGQDPTSPSQALGSLLLAVGVDARQLPSSVDDRARLWRDRTAGRKLLVLLDDAATIEQVRPLLPGDGDTLVLISSRHYLGPLDGIRPITLDVLPEADGVRMLRRIAGRDEGPDDDPADDPAAEIVARWCGRLPLAIALAAARLRGHPTWDSRYLAERLADAHTRWEYLRSGDQSVRAAFQTSFDDLPKRHQHAMRLLGVLPAPEFDAFAIAALIDTEPEIARQDLEAWYEARLVQETTPDRYRLHDLLRAYVQSIAAELTDGERANSLARVQRYYLAAATAAGASLPALRHSTLTIPASSEHPLPRLADADAARRWLVAERSTLIAMLERAVTDTPDWAVRMAATLHTFLRMQGDREELLHVHQVALDAALATGDPGAQAATFADLGVVRMLRDEYESAKDSLANAADLYSRLGDRLGDANVLASTGLLHRLCGDYDTAIGTLRQAHDLYTGLGDELGQANTLTNLGTVHYNLSQYNAAIDVLVRARDLYRGLRDLLGEANTLADLGAVHYNRGDYRQAADILIQANDLYTRLDSAQGQASALADLGSVYGQLGEHTLATRTLTHAHGLYLELGDLRGQAATLTNIGTAARLRGDLDEAADTLTRALHLYTRLESRHGEANVLTNLGAVQHALGLPAEAKDTLLTAHALFDEVKDRDGVAETLNNLGDLALDHPETGEPGRYFDAALTIASDIGAGRHEAHALRGAALSLLRQGEPERARQLLLRSRTVYLALNSPAVDEIDNLLAGLSD